MTNRALNELTAMEALAGMASGEFSSEDITEACLDRIEAREETVQAWVHIDRDQALEQARAKDRERAAGAPIGPLHGIPVALKDIFDTHDMPTENGSNLYAGRRPAVDSFATMLLRQAGAVILGKAVTTEIAMMTPNKTKNPHDPTRTPGGSSSGSCAAVGDNMALLALGSQTAGSTLRPASFCGIHGYKPTFGSISCIGVSPISRKLDHVGPLARSLEDLARLSDVLMIYDPRDEEMRADPGMRLSEALARPLNSPPRIGFAKPPAWREGDPAAFKIFEDFVENLGDAIEAIELPKSYGDLHDHHDKVMNAGLAYFYAEEVTRDPPQMDPRTIERIRAALPTTAGEYLRALDAVSIIEQEVYEAMSGVDALIVPPAPGEAPVGLTTTGSPLFQSPWTLLGMPGIVLPLLKGPAGMPFGVQLMGRKGDDASLFRVAQWVEAKARSIQLGQ
ncbi:MAG: amidase [Pseudomonadota bacterium]|nr:amidase [Pseudomonadota bacterium]